MSQLLSRRSFLISALAAPVIIKAASLMPISAPSLNMTATEVRSRMDDFINRLVNPPLMIDPETGIITRLDPYPRMTEERFREIARKLYGDKV